MHLTLAKINTPVADADADWLCPLSLLFFCPDAFCDLGAGDRDAAFGSFAEALSSWVLPDTLPRFTVVLLDFLSETSLPYSTSKALVQLKDWTLFSMCVLHGADSVDAKHRTQQLCLNHRVCRKQLCSLKCVTSAAAC